MKNTSHPAICRTDPYKWVGFLLSVALVCGTLKIYAATMAIDSLTGAVTQNEIHSFNA